MANSTVDIVNNLRIYLRNRINNIPVNMSKPPVSHNDDRRNIAHIINKINNFCNENIIIKNNNNIYVINNSTLNVSSIFALRLYMNYSIV